jgi:hypothetical protein
MALKVNFTYLIRKHFVHKHFKKHESFSNLGMQQITEFFVLD